MNQLLGRTPFRYRKAQAMTEFVVCVGFIFLGLFIVVPLFGKILDIKYQSLQASRYVAWERTVWLEGYNPGDDNQDDFVISGDEFESIAVRSNDDLYNSVNNRFFYGQGRGIKSIGDSDTGAPAGDVSPIWDYTQSRNSMFRGVALEIEEEDTDSIAYAILDGLADVVDFISTPLSIVLGALGGNEDFLQVDYNMKGYYSPTLRTSLNPDNAKGGSAGDWELNNGGSGIEGMIFQSWDGVFTTNSAILADGWNAQSVGYYQDRADNFVPSSIFDFDIVNILIDIMSVLEGGPANSAIAKLDFGEVGVEPMPGEEGQPLDVTCDEGFCYYDD